jgi:O-antigen/teichoic acid export membrane protein
MSMKRSFVIYTASSIIASALPLALLPLMTHYLSVEEYGIVATMTTLIAFFTPTLTWGVPGIVTVEHGRLAPDTFRQFVATALSVPLVSLLVMTLLAATAAPWMAPLVQVPAPWFAALPLIAGLAVLPQVLSAILRMSNRPMSFGLVEVGQALATVLLSYAFVVSLNGHWQGRMWAYAGAGGLTTLAALIWLASQGYLRRPAGAEMLKEVFRFGLGLLPHDLGNQAIRLADRLFLVAIVGLSGAGLYAVAAQVTAVVMVLLSAFNRVWAPYLFPRLRDPSRETERQLVRISYSVMAGFLAFFVVFNLMVPVAFSWFIDPKFHEAITYVPWLTIGYFFTSVYMTYIDYIFYVKKTYLLSMVTTLNMSLNLGLNYLLIREFGPIGAAYAFAATMFVVMLVAFWLSNKVHPMPWFYWVRRKTAA